MKIAIYSRFSTDKQSVRSTADQERTCREFAARQGFTVADTFSDEGISGGKGEAHRPGYAALLAAARKRAFDAIVCEDVSRLWRDLAEQSTVVNELQFLGVHVIGVNDGIDTRREGFDLLLAIKGAINAGYRKEIGKRTHRGMTGKAIAALPTGGKTYGYKTVYVDEKDHNGRTVSRAVGREIVPEQASIIIEIFEQYASGVSPREIAHKLNQRKVPAPGAAWKRTVRRKDAKWMSTAIWGSPDKATGILNNELYRGVMIWNRSRFVENPATKRRERRDNPESEWIKTEAPDLRIVSDDLWNRVKQAQRDRGIVALHQKRGRGPRYLFSSILKCGVCGGSFIMGGHDAYGCSTWSMGGEHACNNRHRVKRYEVEWRLLEGIRKELLSEKRMDAFQHVLAARLADLRKARPKAAPDQRAIEAIDRKIERLLDFILEGGRTEATHQKLAALEAEKAALEAAAAQAEAAARQAARTVTMIPRALDRYRALVENLGEVSRRDVERARADVRKLVGGEIRLMPATGGLVAEIRGDYGGMLRLGSGKSTVYKSGSGGRI